MPQLPTEALRDYAEKLFVKAGTPANIATQLVGSLILADQSGHPSHGTIRVPRYLEMIGNGRVVPDGRPEIIKSSLTSALIDGHLGFGQFTAAFATQTVIDLARDSGIAIVGCVRCNHTGRIGQWSEMAADQGMILFGAVGGPAGLQGTPFGGFGRALCTNPITASVPGGDHAPMIMDFATTATAEGKIQVARAKGAQLPPGQILNKNGEPSTDPEEFYDGGVLLPFGGHKGYALSLLAEVLASGLTGAGESDENAQLGFTVIAIDPAIFRPVADYGASVDSVFERMEAIPPARRFDGVMIPGEPERRSRASHSGRGIDLAEATIKNLKAEGDRLGVESSPIG